MAPAPAVCPAKRQLADDIREIMDQIIGLSTQQQEAAVSGKVVEAEWLERKLTLARQRKDRALEEYKRHLDSHGC
jgi:hypothetical protein